jgi:hypothetical protein
MQPDIHIEHQKKLREVFKALQEKIITLNKEEYKLGYQQRNALVTHVYSGYNNDENLLAKQKEKEAVGLELRVIKWIYELMKKERDLYGYFEKPDKFTSELQNLIKQSEEKELFEIANILYKWRLKMV